MNGIGKEKSSRQTEMKNTHTQILESCNENRMHNIVWPMSKTTSKNVAIFLRFGFFFFSRSVLQFIQFFIMHSCCYCIVGYYYVLLFGFSFICWSLVLRIKRMNSVPVFFKRLVVIFLLFLLGLIFLRFRRERV